MNSSEAAKTMIPKISSKYPSNQCSLDRFFSNLPCSNTFPLVQNFTRQPSGLSRNSTSDDGDDQQLKIIDQRRQRRMISNRESARRSRMRKQRQLDELWSQVARLGTENHNLINRLSQVSDSYNLIKKENTRLREESFELRKMIAILQAETSRSELSDLRELSIDSTHFTVESAIHSKQAKAISEDFLL
ncbi:Basic leucine zipper 43-like protein [Drosera capensis]